MSGSYIAEERAYLWLCACTDTDLHEKTALLRAAGSPLKLFENAEEIFPAVLQNGAERLQGGYHVREEAIEKHIAHLEERGYFAVMPFSDDYPESLRQISSPPLVLYGAGNRALLAKRKFCVVGSRITPAWAEKLGRDLAAELAEKFAVVTGLAEGGDAAAIAGALPSGNLIVVLPCGLDECYPAAHASLKQKIAERGLLLSELPPAECAKKYSFHARNRILAGLAEGVLVLSAAKRSGTLITANCALDFGRDVFALPHNVGAAHGEGCNDLIRKGAFLVTQAEDILSVYGMEPAVRETAELTEEERRVLAVLRERGEAHLAELAGRADLRVFEASAILSSLEIKGLAVKSGGNKYSAV